jgi:hypothetical protein
MDNEKLTPGSHIGGIHAGILNVLEIAASNDAKDLNRKPETWEEFVDLAVAIHVVKDTDYNHAFMDMLLEDRAHGHSIWYWEVKKKLDRLRRWIKRGQLLVKGEGVLDSVIDLCNYTVQYNISNRLNPYDYLTEDAFRSHYNYLGPIYILRDIVTNCAGKALLDEDSAIDNQVLSLIRLYMGLKD